MNKFTAFAPVTLERLERENNNLRLQLESARRINDASVQQARDLGALVDAVIVAKDRLNELCDHLSIDIDMVAFREAERGAEDAEASLFAAIEDQLLVSAEKLRKAIS
jgi:hypothetical protein